MARLDWTKDEHILALEVYFRYPEARNSKTHPAIFELSELLRSLPIYPLEERDPEFRNTNGIGMKLSNFKRCDPSYPGKGLDRGAELEEAVWKEFAGNLDHLYEAAAAIKTNAARLSVTELQDYISDDEEAHEGRILTVTHKRRERDPGLTAKKKRKVLQETGKLECEACGFNFVAVYGDLGRGFAECHHDKPVSSLKDGDKTKLSDLRILCANCHRMVHRSRPWLTVTSLRDLLAKI